MLKDLTCHGDMASQWIAASDFMTGRFPLSSESLHIRLPTFNKHMVGTEILERQTNTVSTCNDTQTKDLDINPGWRDSVD